MSKESFLLTLLMCHVNKSFIGVTGLFANLSSELLFPALKNLVFNFVSSERKAMLESQPDNSD